MIQIVLGTLLIALSSIYLHKKSQVNHGASKSLLKLA